MINLYISLFSNRLYTIRTDLFLELLYTIHFAFICILLSHTSLAYHVPILFHRIFTWILFGVGLKKGFCANSNQDLLSSMLSSVFIRFISNFHCSARNHSKYVINIGCLVLSILRFYVKDRKSRINDQK